jgi:hypothetical protein
MQKKKKKRKKRTKKEQHVIYAFATGQKHFINTKAELLIISKEN